MRKFDCIDHHVLQNFGELIYIEEICSMTINSLLKINFADKIYGNFQLR